MDTSRSLVENTIVIDAEVAAIFPMVAAIERWPEILPHYRRVVIVTEGPEGRVAEMAAWRGRIPVRWWAIQQIDPDTPSVRFRHTQGFTRGMAVEWRFERALSAAAIGPATSVTISHDLSAISPGLKRRLVGKVIAPMFIDYIATRTLQSLKLLAEGARKSDSLDGVSNSPQIQTPIHSGRAWTGIGHRLRGGDGPA